MHTRPRPRLPVPALLALVLVAGAWAAPARAAGTDASGPRIRYAIAVDRNRNDHIDGLRVVFDRPIRHRRDVDAPFPFSVEGYTVTGVMAAHGRTVLVDVQESAGGPDIHAAPQVSYAPTAEDPVVGRNGVPAEAQATAAVVALDADGDGYTPADGDCDDADPTIHPGAPDQPDLAQVDSNCDGIDGTAADAIFVAPGGNDAAAGTMAAPKRTINAAVEAAASYSPPKEVYVAAGHYDEGQGVTLRSDVGIYGGYVDGHWNLRGTASMTVIEGSPQAAIADGATGVVLQLLTLSGQRASGPGADPSVYGLREINGAEVTLQSVRVTAADGRAGAPGEEGTNGGSAPSSVAALAGRDAGPVPVTSAACSVSVAGTQGGAAPGYPGGAGGAGGSCGQQGGVAGTPGAGLSDPAPGGAGGPASLQGDGSGLPGAAGAPGSPGTPGAAGAADFERAGPAWAGEPGAYGSGGSRGGGGGGGGGGAAWACTCYPTAYPGGSGGGGGAGGAGGNGGAGGDAGGGSFAVYLWNSSITVESSTLVSGDGGAGGAGGDAGTGGKGGAGGRGGQGGLGGDVGITGLDGYGVGGDGGHGGAGGDGGDGGGGAGGPSIGIFRAGTSTANVDSGTLILYGLSGPGGASGAAGTSTGSAGQVGAVEPPP